jgi:phage shock protein A
MLEKMKNKVQEEESLAAAYGEIAAVETSIDDEINTALSDTRQIEATDQLAALKAKLSATTGS